MKSLLRLVACLLSALLFFGCAGIRACIRAEEPDASNAERDALWEQLLSERPDTPPVSDPVLTVVFLDVGQGDCVFLSAPDGQTMLVDAGPVGSYPAIAETLACYGVDSLDVVVATHPHADHIGAMADVLDAWPVGTFCTTEQTLSMGGDLNRAATVARLRLQPLSVRPDGTLYDGRKFGSWTLSGNQLTFKLDDHNITLNRDHLEDVTPDGVRIGGLLAGTFGARFSGSRAPSAGRLAHLAIGHPGILTPEPLPIYLSPAVRT